MRFRPFIIAVVASFLSPTLGYGASLYLETGAGIAQIRGASEFFGDGAPSVLGLGASLNLTLGANLSARKAPIAFHVGIQHRFTTGSDTLGSYALQASYPMIRVEMEKVFFGLGATPLVWKRTGLTAGVDGFAMEDSAIAILGEFGVQLPITPDVAFIMSSAVQAVKTSTGNFSPMPSIEGSFALRFFIGGGTSINAPDARKDRGGLGEYEGHRYPFGIELNH